MKKTLARITTIAAVIAASIGIAGATQCPTTNVATNPEIFQWTHHPVSADNPEEYYSGVLEMGAETLTIGGDTLTTRMYRQAGGAYGIPAPTLIMQPGNKYVLQFENTLPYEQPSTEHNVFRNPNISNVHTHGLHISGESPSDDVTRMFEGGFGGDYVWDIPADHMGGSFWYHAHHHGSTLLQVSNGAFGMIIVDDSADELPANVVAMEERHMIFGYLDPSTAGSGGDTIVGGTLAPTWTLNGKKDANVCMPPDTWQHWRVLVADRDARLMDFEVGSNCDVELLARDGVWRTEAPKAITTNTLSLTGASRADIAVRCSADSTVSVAGAQEAQIFVDGTPDPTVHPYNTDGVSPWSAKRPVYLRNLRSEVAMGVETIRMGARTINGKKFDKNVPTLSTLADGVQQWTIKGALNHPFHLHIYHVQMDGACGEFEDGEFYDVVAGNCRVRFDLNDAMSSVYEGRTIMHCHILEHEDQGAMGWLNVVGGDPAPGYPADASISPAYSAYYSLGGGTGNQPPVAGFSYNCTDLDCSFTDTSTDDSAIASWAWDFGDGAASTQQNPSHTFAAAGTYSVALTVTDDESATDIISQDVTVTDPPVGGDFPLNASGRKVRGVITSDLTWSGAAGTNVDIYRNGALLVTAANDGAYTDSTGKKGGGSFTYQVCEAGATTTCSNEATVAF